MKASPKCLQFEPTDSPSPVFMPPEAPEGLHPYTNPASETSMQISNFKVKDPPQSLIQCSRQGETCAIHNPETCHLLHDIKGR